MTNEMNNKMIDGTKIQIAVHHDVEPCVIVMGSEERMSNLEQSMSGTKSEIEEQWMATLSGILRHIKLHDLTVGEDKAILAIVV